MEMDERKRKVLIIVENLPVPLYFSQIWLERQTYKHYTFAFVTNES